jgi:tetratricopeptide (TPR) repeat protein
VGELRIALRLVLAAWFMLAAFPASAEWLEARSDHFRIYGDMREPALTEFATRLERFDKAQRFLRGLGDDPLLRANPLTIYVVNDVAQVQRLCGKGCQDVYGFYVPRANGSIAYTPRRSGSGTFDLQAEAVLLHEYTHHFMRQNYTAAYPAWFFEGFAEFNSTTKFFPNGDIQFGRAPMHRAFALFRGDPLPLTQMLGGDLSRLSHGQRDTLYGRGWLLTHYLTFDEARAGQLKTYINQINLGVAPLKAAEQAFGDLKALDRDLDRYLGRRTITGFTVPAALTPIGPISVRRLGAGEAAMMPVRLRSDRGVDRETAAQVVIDARRRATPFPNDPAAQRALAEAEYDAGDDDAAEAAADRALAADPAHRGAMLYKGRVLVRRATLAKTRDPATWKAARSWFIKANKLDTSDAEPLTLFYGSFLAAGEKPTRNAVDALMAAFYRAPHDDGLRMVVVRQLLADGDRKSARHAVAPLAFDPHGGEDNLAAKILARIDAGDPPETIAAQSAGSDSQD